MLLAGLTVLFILIGVAFFVWGAIALSKYAFRLGTGTGLLTLLFPPYTFYFALFKLEEEGKSWPTASWLLGLILTVLLTIAFFPQVKALATGNKAYFEDAESGAAATAEKDIEEAEAEEEEKEEEFKEEQDAEEEEEDEEDEEDE
ncbi:MAG: hypothetical protein ACOCV2_04555, partial [Persicimonas sp.]